ncbi:hypothetical protein [Polaromonas aquatica]|uniref:Uncharacterized protein n=1 Tax=Polaromonas aquatica TaxID=332657 RepID=A0ABW1TUA0_9BURK
MGYPILVDANTRLALFDLHREVLTGLLKLAIRSAILTLQVLGVVLGVSDGKWKAKKRRPEGLLFLLGSFQDLFDLGLAVNDLLLADRSRIGSSESNNCVDSYNSDDDFDEFAHDDS